MTIPQHFEDTKQLKNMSIGQSGYVVCWAMWVDKDGKCFLNEAYSYHEEKGGTVQLKITRVKAGYIAHIHDLEDPYEWTRQSMPGHSSDLSLCYGEVVGFEHKGFPFNLSSN
jgi:hypothetical protein